MENKYTWAIEDIFNSDEEFFSAYSKAEGMLDFSAYVGKLENAQVFLECAKKEEQVSRLIERLGEYAMMKRDMNAADSIADSMYSKVVSISSAFASATAFITPELSSLPESVLKSFIEDSQLCDYDYFFKTLLKDKAHVLSEKEEKMLAESSQTLSTFKDIFSKIDNADLPLKPFKHRFKTHTLTHGTYSVYMHSSDRKLREKAFKNYYSAFTSLINTISTTYFGNVKKNVFISKTRKFNSSLERALSNEDVSREVYDNLLECVNGALPTLHEYMQARKDILGLDKMHMYDIYVPLVKNAELKLSYDDAYDLVVKGLSVLGNDYVELLQKARNERWIDVYESKGKRSGAYSTSSFDTHPYVLLNYQPTTHDVFTIAHEMGHSIHSYFSNKAQPYSKAYYTIFVAEVASTVNEVLLLKYLLSTATDRKLKKYLLSYLLEMIRTTLFRQTQFAEFEEWAHRSVEEGTPLSKDVMCEKYLSLNRKYYGNAVESDDEIQYEWARIPHFYNAFYVYKYATGITSALAIADRILTEGQPAIDDYFRFLSSGGSDSPVQLLKIAGVDLTDKKPFISAFKTFENALKEFKEL